jgi:hypothetical protein
MADHRHDVTMAARPRAQHAEPILSVVVGYSFDETCQHFPGLRTHADYRISIDLANRLQAGGIFFLCSNSSRPLSPSYHRGEKFTKTPCF